MIGLVLFWLAWPPPAAGPCRPTAQALAKAIESRSHAPRWSRSLLAELLARSIVREAARFGLDPVALAAVGKVESDFRVHPRGPGYLPKGYGAKVWERGVYQIAPRSAAALSAWRAMRRCLLTRRARRAGAAVREAATCPGLEVWRRKLGFAHFNAADLRDPIVSTWVAAFEIAEHLARCRRRAPRGHGWKDRWHLRRLARRRGIPLQLAQRLHRWSHYNMGPSRPRFAYTRRLVAAYLGLRRAACGR